MTLNSKCHLPPFPETSKPGDSRRKLGDKPRRAGVWVLGCLGVSAALGALAPVALYGASTASPAKPQAVVDELLATDRAFAARSAAAPGIAGLTAMFAAEVTIPVPGGKFAHGADEVAAALAANPDNATARLDWTPVRGGVSADGQHGFTFGLMTQHKADGSTVPLRYLSYWIKGPDGWRVAAYKRSRSAPGEVAAVSLPPALPAKLVPPVTDASVIEGHRAGLSAAETAFALEAQSIGLGPAFTKWGSDDAMNMGGPGQSGFVIGAAAIGRAVSGGEPEGAGSSVNWGPDKVLVASSGDLGVTFGLIRPNASPPPGEAAPPPFPFFTVWRRAAADAPWRYVAE